MNGLKAVFPEFIVRKVPKIECDDCIGFDLYSYCRYVPIIGVW